MIEDVALEPSYEPHRAIAAAAGYRSVQSTPLLSRGGKVVLGVLSTHYANPYHPSPRDLQVLDLYTRQAAEYIDVIRSAEALSEQARQLQKEDERKGFFLKP